MNNKLIKIIADDVLELGKYIHLENYFVDKITKMCGIYGAVNANAWFWDLSFTTVTEEDNIRLNRDTTEGDILTTVRFFSQ